MPENPIGCINESVSPSLFSCLTKRHMLLIIQKNFRAFSGVKIQCILLLSHLRHCSETSGRFPFGLVCLDICEHSNRSLMRNEATELRWPWRGGLSSIPFETWSGSFAVRKQPTQRLEEIALICSVWQQRPQKLCDSMDKRVLPFSFVIMPSLTATFIDSRF